MLLALVCGWPAGPVTWRTGGYSLILFILLLLLGWHDFGAPIHN